MDLRVYRRVNLCLTIWRDRHHVTTLQLRPPPLVMTSGCRARCLAADGPAHQRPHVVTADVMDPVSIMQAVDGVDAVIRRSARAN